MQLLKSSVRHRRHKTQELVAKPVPREKLDEALHQTSAYLERIDMPTNRKVPHTLPNIFDLQASIRDAARFQRKLGLVMHMRNNHSTMHNSETDKTLSISWARRCGNLAQSRRTSRHRQDLPTLSTSRKLEMKRRQDYLRKLERQEEMVKQRRQLLRAQKFETILEYIQ